MMKLDFPCLSSFVSSKQTLPIYLPKLLSYILLYSMLGEYPTLSFASRGKGHVVFETLKLSSLHNHNIPL